MFKVMTDDATSVDTRPWRKRHPVISRTLLYGLGLGLAALLFVLFTERKADDEATRIEALQKELDGLSLVLATDPTGDVVLAKLDEKFSGDDLPVITQGRSLRWRAMAWRRKANTASTDAEKQRAVQEVEKALEACAALQLEPAERFALQLEWAEARLERRDVTRARQVLPDSGDLIHLGSAMLPSVLLLSLLEVQAKRLEGQAADAAVLAVKTVQAIEPPLGQQIAYVGGRDWTAAQVGIELASFATQVGDPALAGPAWKRLRAAAAYDFEVQVAAARGLLRAGDRANARSAWRSAKALNADLAAAEARRDAGLAALDAEDGDR